MQIFSRLKNVSSQSISTCCVLYSVVIIPLLPVHRTIENFSVELSRADAAATALQLYILSSHHAQEILPRKLEYYLPVPCQIRHIDFDACYSLCSSLFALCRSDSCWVMEHNDRVYYIQLELAWYISLGGWVIPVGFMTSNWSYFEFSHQIYIDCNCLNQ